ncbi:MAG: hypothetical protein ACP5R2_06640 [Anaerolineae bacterium]
MATPITRAQVEKALNHLTPHPLKLWHLNPNGTITAINTIGQKFVLAVETIRLNPPPRDEVPAARRPKARTRKARIREPQSAIPDAHALIRDSH